MGARAAVGVGGVRQPPVPRTPACAKHTRAGTPPLPSTPWQAGTTTPHPRPTPAKHTHGQAPPLSPTHPLAGAQSVALGRSVAGRGAAQWRGPGGGPAPLSRAPGARCTGAPSPAAWQGVWGGGGAEGRGGAGQRVGHGGVGRGAPNRSDSVARARRAPPSLPPHHTHTHSALTTQPPRTPTHPPHPPAHRSATSSPSPSSPPPPSRSPSSPPPSRRCREVEVLMRGWKVAPSGGAAALASRAARRRASSLYSAS